MQNNREEEMGIARIFCGFFASLMIAITAQNAFAAAYQCNLEYREYTSCIENYRLNRTGNGNSCVKCPNNSHSDANNTNTYCQCDTGYQQSEDNALTITNGDNPCVLSVVTCEAGYYLPAGDRTCTICPSGKYCTGGDLKPSSTADVGITGTIAAGYYSTGGGTRATPTRPGNGCLSGQSCGRVSAGYYSTGGGVYAKPTDTTDCVAGDTANTCGLIAAGYYSTGGGTSATPTRNGSGCAGLGTTCGKVNAGYYSTGGGTSATPTSTNCGGTKAGTIDTPNTCGLIAAGYYGVAGATQNTGSGTIAAGYYSTGGGTSATPTGNGSGCAGDGTTCGKVNAGYYSTGGGTSATPTSTNCVTKAGTTNTPNTCGLIAAGYYGVAGATQNTGSGKVNAGYYSTGGGTSATPTSTSCVGIKAGTTNIPNSCGLIAAGYYGAAGATQNAGSGTIAAGYYSTGGGTSSTPTRNGSGCAGDGTTCGVCKTGYSTGGGTNENCTSCNETVNNVTYAGWAATGTNAADHDNANDCKQEFTLNKNDGSGTLSTFNTANTVTDSMGGNNDATIVCSRGVDCYLPTTNGILTLRGYTFINKWNTETNRYESSGDTAVKPNGIDYKTLYALRNANTYMIVLNKNCKGSNIGSNDNCVGASPSTIYEHFDNGWKDSLLSSTKIDSVTIPTQRGYTFTGFYNDYASTTDQPDGITDIIDKDGKILVASNTFASNKTLFAHWIENPYTITFDPTGGIIDGDSDDKDKMTVNYDNAVDSIVTPRKPGYTFAGYYTKKDGAGTMYFDENGDYAIKNVNGEWRDITDITLYAAWTICPAGWYCPGNTSHEIYSCDGSGVGNESGLIERIEKWGQNNDLNHNYWNRSTQGSASPNDCYHLCRQTGASINDDPKDGYGHGTLACTTGQESDGVCVALYPNSCTYRASLDVDARARCNNGFQEANPDTEILECEPMGYSVIYHANDGTTDEWKYSQSCFVSRQCRLEDLTSGENKLPDRPGYVFTGWSQSRVYTTNVWNAVDENGNAVDLLQKLPGEGDGPTGTVRLYAIWGKCDYGYYWDGLAGVNKCLPCPVDTYKSHTSVANGEVNQLEQCSKCDLGTYTGEGIEGIAKKSVNDCKQCTVGSYCDGNGIKRCPVYNPGDNFTTVNKLLDKRYTSAPSQSKESDCYFECPELKNGTDISYGNATPDKTTVNAPAQCTYTCVSVTGNPGHVENGRCIEDECNPEFEFMLEDGIKKCTACFATQPEIRELVISYTPGKNCKIKSCIAGYHPTKLGDNCQLDERECKIDHAIKAYETWNPTDGKYTCTPRECQENFHIVGNSCVSDTKKCEIENGKGEMIWDDLHNRWGDCIVESCDPGYTSDPYESNEPAKKCGECRNKYGVDGEIAVALYKNEHTIECEIKYCNDQGERYNLEGNECVPICTDGYSDETGYMKWNPSSHKCERTCNEGYVPWN